MTATLELIPLKGFPLVEPGDNLAQLIFDALRDNDLTLRDGDVLVVAQKIVSKAENRYVRLADVQVSAEAQALAEQAGKDPRQVQLILQESRAVLRVRPGVIIVEHRNGYVHANAGIDRSNIVRDEGDPRVLLLPMDPDSSARGLRDGLAALGTIAPQVIINDSMGRAWRNGTVGLAIGTAGLEPLLNQIGDVDMFGNVLEVTEPAVADELAAGASLVMGQAAEGCPVVLARGANLLRSNGGSTGLLRDKSNIVRDEGDPRVLLLPTDPDASARGLRDGLAALGAIAPQVIINDSMGRAWRNGTVGLAIGTAGLDPLRNQVGEKDLFGNVLEATEPAVADELAAAASLVMGQAAEGCPVVLARGAELRSSGKGSAGLLRDRSIDLFR